MYVCNCCMSGYTCLYPLVYCMSVRILYTIYIFMYVYIYVYIPIYLYIYIIWRLPSQGRREGWGVAGGLSRAPPHPSPPQLGGGRVKSPLLKGLRGCWYWCWGVVQGNSSRLMLEKVKLLLMMLLLLLLWVQVSTPWSGGAGKGVQAVQLEATILAHVLGSCMGSWKKICE